MDRNRGVKHDGWRVTAPIKGEYEEERNRGMMEKRARRRGDRMISGGIDRKQE